MSNQDERLLGIGGGERPAEGEPIEERGIVNEVIVPIVVSGTGGAAAGAASAVVTNLLNKKDKDK